MNQPGYAIVTGATSGIGKAFAYKLAKENYNLILVGRNEVKLQHIKEKLEARFSVHIIEKVVDVTKKEDIQRFIDWLDEFGILIYLFVNNAGIGSFGNFKDIDMDTDLEVVRTNILGFTHLLKGVCKNMSKGSTVLQVASTAAFAPGPQMAVYYASKSYVLSLSLALREEMKKDGVGVCTLCPGPTNTHFQERAHMQKSDFVKQFHMSAMEVVQVAYRGMLKNQAIIVPGTVNKLSVLTMCSLPPQLQVKLVGKTQGNN